MEEAKAFKQFMNEHDITTTAIQEVLRLNPWRNFYYSIETLLLFSNYSIYDEGDECYLLFKKN